MLKFFKYSAPLGVSIFVLVTVELITFLVFVIGQGYIYLLTNILLLFIWGGAYIAFRRTLFLTVIIDENELKICYKNDICHTMSWYDVVKVERVTDQYSQNFVFEDVNKKQIVFNSSIRKKYLIAETCPRDDIKKQIKALKFAFDFHKK